MIALDRNAFICDMAETYQILDYHQIPGRLLGILAAGLGEESRIVRKLAGRHGSVNTMLMAQILDSLNILVWWKTKDGKKNRNRPDSMYDRLFVDPYQEKQHKQDLETFASGAAFDAEWKRLKEG